MAKKYVESIIMKLSMTKFNYVDILVRKEVSLKPSSAANLNVVIFSKKNIFLNFFNIYTYAKIINYIAFYVHQQIMCTR